jgi:DNA-binding CsgD family transcriptional regulator
MSPQAGFVLQNQVIPPLRSAIPNVVHCVGAECHNELIQDSIAMACSMMAAVEKAGKKVTPGNIAYYCIQKIKSGRRSTGSSYVDVYGSRTQLNGTTRLTSLEDVAGVDEETGGEIYFHDVLSRDEEDPATKALRNIDYQTFMATLSAREQAIINCLAEGKPLASLARRRHLNNSTLLYHKDRLALKIQDFMGSDILIQIRRKPNWKDSLDASRERLACREERRHL